MSKAFLKNKVDSIRRTLKAQGIEVASPIIESKIFELYPDFENDWSSDVRAEVIASLTKDLQPSQLTIVDSDMEQLEIEELEPDQTEPISTLALTDSDKREITLHKSQELGITLSEAEVSLIADSVEQCGENLDELLNELETTLTAYIDHKAKLNSQKIDTALDRVGGYAEQRFGDNSQHLSNRLKTLGDKMEGVATQNKSQVKSLLSRFRIPNSN